MYLIREPDGSIHITGSNLERFLSHMATQVRRDLDGRTLARGGTVEVSWTFTDGLPDGTPPGKPIVLRETERRID